MKQLKFEQRKIVHYTLLTAIVLLQILVVLTWYNENKLNAARDGIAIARKADRINSSMVEAQRYFNDYIVNKEQNSLQNYSKSIGKVVSIADSLPANSEKKSLLLQRNKILSHIRALKSGIDSIIDGQLKYQNEVPDAFIFHDFRTDKFLDDVKTKSFVKVDPAAKKGLFSRLGDAIANRANVQKEYVNTVVTMQYKDKVITGNLEQQMANALDIANEYYADEFLKLKRSFSSLRKNDMKLMELNNSLLNNTQNIVSDYLKSNKLEKPNTVELLDNQYQNHRTIRSFTIILLILLMLVVSVILFVFTRVAFEYEKRLTSAQEEIRQNLNFKNRITGMISHEIRSPLSIISMYSKKVSQTAKEPELIETFKSIEYTTNSLLLLSNQILEYSKSEDHKMELKQRKVQLKTEIDQIINSLSSLAATKGNRIQLNSNLTETDEVYTDVAKIHQLFYNLIGNANKFTENGLIGVDVKLTHISGYESDLNVVISDNGTGIAENELSNIFESYYQGTVSEKMNDLGVGLGLNICREIVELFDGTISIESKPGAGTKVAFNLMMTQV